MPKRIRVLTSDAAEYRFLLDCGEMIGEIPRCSNIPSPYCSSPVHVVFDWHGQKIFFVETRHRRYEVFLVPPDVPLSPLQN